MASTFVTILGTTKFKALPPVGGSDITAPDAPTGLIATASDGSVALVWTPNDETDLASYTVYRSTTSGSGFTELSSGIGTNSYSDVTVSNGTTYYYTVTATDTTGNESAQSTERQATPADTTAPSAPTGFGATASDSQVILDWSDNSEPDLASYTVYRSTTSGSGFSELVNSVGVSTYTDSTAVNGTTYYYHVKAVDTSSNESSASFEVSATPTAAVLGTFDVTAVEYGAVGDGVTDDTVAIRAAITAAESWADANTPSVATVYFPAGTYAVSDQSGDTFANGVFRHVLPVTTSNIKFLGDGSASTHIQRYLLEPYSGTALQEPDSTWHTVSDLSEYNRVERAGLFYCFSTGVDNITWEGLHLNGRFTPTGLISPGGKAYLSTSASSIITNEVDGDFPEWYSDGMVVRMGTILPSGLEAQKPYYVVNSTATTFQLSDTLGGAALTIGDLSNFKITNGDGWVSGDNAIHLNAVDNTGHTITDVIAENFSGEIIYGGGGSLGPCTITNCTLQLANSSMVSHPNVSISDSTIQYGYNGVENFCRGASQSFTCDNVIFNGSSDGSYGEDSCIVYLGYEASSATITRCTFNNTGWSNAIKVSQKGNNMTIGGSLANANTFNDTLGVGISRLLNGGNDALYPSDPASEKNFNNIEISYNTFNHAETSNGSGRCVYMEYSDSETKNFTFSNNTIARSPINNYRWKNVIEEVGGSTAVGQRTGGVADGNDFWSNGGHQFTNNDTSTRLAWSNSTQNWKGSDQTDSSTDNLDPYLKLTDDYERYNNRSTTEWTTTIDPAFITQGLSTMFPTNFQTEIFTTSGTGSRSIRIPADATWNTWVSDIVLDGNTATNTATIQFNGTKFDDITA